MTDAIRNDDDRHTEFMALVNQTLGEDYDADKIAAVDALQVDLFAQQADLYARYSAHLIAGPEYVTQINELSATVFRSCEKVLGSDDFETLFGSSVDDEPWLIDMDAFLYHEELYRRALSAAHEHSDDLTFTSDMTREEMRAKFDALIAESRSRQS